MRAAKSVILFFHFECVCMTMMWQGGKKFTSQLVRYSWAHICWIKYLNIFLSKTSRFSALDVRCTLTCVNEAKRKKDFIRCNYKTLQVNGANPSPGWSDGSIEIMKSFEKLEKEIEIPDELSLIEMEWGWGKNENPFMIIKYSGIFASNSLFEPFSP